MTPSPILEAKGVCKSFDGFAAVKNARVRVEKGRVTAVIGPNGAGKTTLFDLITGMSAPDSGEIRLKGRNIAGLAPHRVCRAGIGRSFQVPRLFPRLTVFENVQIAVLARLKKTWTLFSPARRMAREETADILEKTGLSDKAKKTGAELSHGDHKVLEMAMALGSAPELLIFDEPTAGMSSEETARAMTLIRRMSEEMGLAVLFCEHDIDLVFSMAHEIMAMAGGETIAQGTPGEIRKNSRVQSAYLGGEAFAGS
ncbi:ABC transporter ATP-binding protein [Candidatus Desulfarcum epimagneticum]|uniref:ABC transporter ATP-binding protein n=1 Tax=uncultured Desulfobacteraceae bacterium TaxID=218296 RepID=A0A484HIW0_9BACT|nr:ABC transporter ATP-binding protein [uncultured Desulfobacteraceae bacterium]